jgi:hypothetical protein
MRYGQSMFDRARYAGSETALFGKAQAGQDNVGKLFHAAAFQLYR